MRSEVGGRKGWRSLTSCRMSCRTSRSAMPRTRTRGRSAIVADPDCTSSRGRVSLRSVRFRRDEGSLSFAIELVPVGLCHSSLPARQERAGSAGRASRFPASPHCRAVGLRGFARAVALAEAPWPGKPLTVRQFRHAVGNGQLVRRGRPDARPIPVQPAAARSHGRPTSWRATRGRRRCTR